MSPLNRPFILAATFGLLFLAPSVGLPTYQLPVLTGPSKVQEEISHWNRKTRLGLAGNRKGDLLSQAGDKVLLAQAQPPSKKKD